jgi:virginiamycin B lyase
VVGESGKRQWFLAAICALALLPCAAPAAAAPVPSHAVVTTFPQPRTLPTGGAGPLVIGPDGNVWFTQVYEENEGRPGEEPRHPPRIARMNSLGQVGVVAEHERAEGFALAADGSVWFTGGFGSIGRVRPDGTVQTVPLPENETEFTSAGGPIVIGSDGNAWFSAYRSPKFGFQGTTVAAIDRVTAAGAITEFALPGAGGSPTRLALGPDGNVWFTERGDDSAGWISPSGQITSLPLPRGSRPGNIVAGPDGALWFTEESDSGAMLGRLGTSGEFREFPLGADQNLSAGALAAGPDGRLWFTLESGAIQRISPQGRISRLQLPNATGVNQIVTGPEGSLWYSAAAGPPCAPGDSGCGAGGYFEAGIIGRVEPAPLAVTIDAATPAQRGRWVRVGLSCLDGRAESVCRGKLRLRSAGAVVAKRSVELGSDLSRAFSLELRRGGWERLRRAGHLRVVCKLALAGGVGQSRTLRIRLPGR